MEVEAACIVAVVGVSEWILVCEQLIPQLAPTNPASCSLFYHRSRLGVWCKFPQLEEAKFERWRKCGAGTRKLYLNVCLSSKLTLSPSLLYNKASKLFCLVAQKLYQVLYCQRAIEQTFTQLN